MITSSEPRVPWLFAKHCQNRPKSLPMLGFHFLLSVGVCCIDARFASMQRPEPCLSFVWSLAHSRRVRFYARSKRESAKFHVCVSSDWSPLRSAPTKNNGKLDSDPRFINPWLVPQSSNTPKTQPKNNLSDVSQAILSYNCPEPQHRASRREEKLFKQQP